MPGTTFNGGAGRRKTDGRLVHRFHVFLSEARRRDPADLDQEDLRPVHIGDQIEDPSGTVEASSAASNTKK